MYEKGGVVLSNSDQNYQSVVGNDIGLDMQIFEKNMDDKTFRGSDGQKYILVNNYSDYLNMDLSSYVSERLIYNDLYHYRNLFFLFTGVAIVMVAAYLVAANMFVNRPIKLLVKSLVKVEQGELDVRIQHNSNDEFGYLYSAFNRMLDSLDEMIELNYRQKMLTQDAELRQLQSQINPHFLYNSFFILYRMAKDEDYENITEFLTYLSDYYRYITRNARGEVPLTDEVNHAQKYAQIQFIRFRKRLSIDFEDLPKQFNNLMVPRLILQPLLENAFNHGLKDVASGGLLKVSFEEKAGTLVIKVEDNGEGVGEEEFLHLQQRIEQTGDMEETTGLVNINKRLQLKFGKEYGLRLVQPETGGMCSELLLPLNKD
jgi:two-component system sensor histidine kinase YesM